MAVALVIVLADQISKFVVLHLVRDGRQVSLPGSAELVYFENRLLGFGLSSAGLLTATLAALAALLLLYISLLRRGYRMSFFAEFSAALLLGGCAGILIDRVRLGFVIDWLDLGPASDFIYNLADLAILAGGVLFFTRGTQLMLRRAGRSLAARKSGLEEGSSAILPDASLEDAAEMGRRAAQQMRAHLGDLSLREMAAALGVEIQHKPLPPPGLSPLRVRSEYLSDSATVVLYDEPLRELSLLIAEKRPDLAGLNLEDLHIAHEIFHHLLFRRQARRGEESESRISSEKAASVFAAELLGLDFSPEELDSLHTSE